MGPDPRFWSGKRVCVTGGSGLLGYQIVRQLLGLGARVRVLALRPPSYHPIHHASAVEAVWGDVRDRAQVRRGLDDCDVVFHAAGMVADWGPALRRLTEAHVEGTRHVLDAAAPSARVVVTSSVVAVGASRTRGPLTEDGPFRLDRLQVEYVHAKRAAERLALDAAARGRDVVVTNPGYMVGPEDWELSVMGRFCDRFWKGQVPIAPPRGLNLVDARDCATGHLLAAERGQAGRRYILGGEDRTFAEFLALLARVAGLRPRALPTAPSWLLTALARASECRARLTREQPYPSVQQARLSSYYWFYSSERAVRELGYQARPLAECLAETHQWFSAVKSVQTRGLSRWWMRPDPAARLRPCPPPHLALSPAIRRRFLEQTATEGAGNRDRGSFGVRELAPALVPPTTRTDREPASQAAASRRTPKRRHSPTSKTLGGPP